MLEIGTGSGFLTACLGRLAREVVSIERHADLADAARARLAAQRHAATSASSTADAFAWQTERRFDAICVTGAVADDPAALPATGCSPDGRLFVVRGRSPAMEAVLVRNDVNAPRIESLFETDLPYLAGAAPGADLRVCKPTEGPCMSRRPLVLALALALSAGRGRTPKTCADLRAGARRRPAVLRRRIQPPRHQEGSVQARAALLPQING